MKKNYLFAFALMALLWVSCQSESSVEDTSGALGPESALTAQLSAVAATANDPGFVIDSTHCFNIKLPVTVKINGMELYIESESGYAEAEYLLGQQSFAVNTLEYVFPITIEYMNGSQVRVNNMDDYNTLRQACENSTTYLSPECFSLSYPLTILGYNSGFQVQQTLTVNNNAEFYNYLANLGSGQYYALNYPVTAYIAGEPILIATNVQLQQAINNATAACAH